MVSKALIDKVKTSSLKQWEIAQKAKIHPSLLSQITNKLINVKHNDARVVAVGRVVGLSRDDCFE